MGLQNALVTTLGAPHLAQPGGRDPVLWRLNPRLSNQRPLRGPLHRPCGQNLVPGLGTCGPAERDRVWPPSTPQTNHRPAGKTPVKPHTALGQDWGVEGGYPSSSTTPISAVGSPALSREIPRAAVSDWSYRLAILQTRKLRLGKGRPIQGHSRWSQDTGLGLALEGSLQKWYGQRS